VLRLHDLIMVPRASAFALLPNDHVGILGESSRPKGSGLLDDVGELGLVLSVHSLPRVFFGAREEVGVDGDVFILRIQF